MKKLVLHLLLILQDAQVLFTHKAVHLLHLPHLRLFILLVKLMDEFLNSTVHSQHPAKRFQSSQVLHQYLNPNQAPLI